MVKVSYWKRQRLRYAAWKYRGGSLQRRFVIRVLMPPFIILLIFGVATLFEIAAFTRNQAVGELNRSAVSTAAKLEREFAVRQTVLKRTGEDLFKIKADYRNSRLVLDKNRDACSSYVKQKRAFLGAPDGVCDPFLQAFAAHGTSLQAIEDQYADIGKQLVQNQEQKTQDRLSAYNQFFPETQVLLVSDTNQKLVSSATSTAFKASTDILLPYLYSLDKQAVEGELLTINNLRLAVFAYPISGGSVLAAYNLDSSSFINQTWESTPIDRTKALAVILDSSGEIAYPATKIGDNFKNYNTTLRQRKYHEIKLRGVSHVVVSAEAGTSKWLVAVASPQAAVFGPLRDAQLIVAIVIGLLLVGFLWFGAIFIHRTVRSIMQLVSGSLLYAGGKLDYIIRLPKADKEFIQLAEAMNVMAWRIADAEKEIDKKNKEFISIATHELRTPLTAILGNLSMAIEDYGTKLHGPVKSIIDEAHNSTLRLRDQVNDMLDAARLEGGRVEFVIAEQDIKNVIQDTLDTLKIVAKTKKINLSYQSNHAVTVLADISKLRIVLNNFVSNAIKYNQPNGSIKVFHELKDGQLVTAIADTGLGIPNEQKPHIFEKFFRVTHADRKNVTGTGLGMYITRRYILAMSGRVWFESEHGKGTTFYFSLPIAKSAERVPAFGSQGLGDHKSDQKLLPAKASK